MYNLCRTTHPSLGVELSLYCNFFTHSEKCLVLAGANLLRVFRLVPEGLPKSTRKIEKQVLDANAPKVKLECMATFTLHANVASMACVSLTPLRDSLLLAFKDAKVSVVEYDPYNHDLRTVSLHYFEKEDIKGGWTHNPSLPMVRVDPEGRCAAVLIYGRKIVILPFQRQLLPTEGVSGRGTVQSSYLIDPKEFEAPRVENIADLQFLHGYYDPTLMLLFEPIKTYPGRVAVRHDTFAIAAISLNISQRLHPIIWSLSGLPHDCQQLLAVPKPIGGVLLFAANCLVYLTQSVPPYGVSLNSMAEKNTNFPLKKQEGIVASLDAAHVEFLTEERVVISLKGGELYVLTLVADSVKTVRSFHFDRSAASVLTCSMSLCEDQYLFLGSRLGNSLLLRFTEKEIVDPMRVKGNVSAENEPPLKKKKVGALGDWIATNVEEIQDDVALEVYGKEDTSVINLTSYAFEVMDSLLNIGPCGEVAMGEPAFLSEEYENTLDPCVELVSTSGHGKNGALCVVQRSIKPQVLTTFDLPEVEDMWTLIGKGDEKKRREGLPDHSFLILSRNNSSLVLRTEEEIDELEDSGFNISAKTIFAANIGNNRYIVQVTGGGVRLLEGSIELQHLPIDFGSPLVAATSTDPYLVVLADDGTVIIFTLITGKYVPPRFTVNRPVETNKSRLETISAYSDMSGLFTMSYRRDRLFMHRLVKSEAEIKRELDDEDELLYRASTSEKAFSIPTLIDLETEKKTTNEWWKKWQKEIRPSYWLAGVRENGDFELYSLPDFKLSYTVKSIWKGNRVLCDYVEESEASEDPHLELQTRVVNEVLLVGIGHLNLRPMLLIRVDDDLLMYEVFQFFEGLAPLQLKLRFRLVEHNLILRERRTNRPQKRPDGTEEFEKKVDRQILFRPFQNISVYSGIFICGLYPYWLFMTVRGELRFHPMNVDGTVKCFAPFRNVNCQNGFLYFNVKDSLRICLLPTILSYDAPWPVRKVPLRCTPHFIVHHLETKTYCVVTSNLEATMNIWKFNGDDKEEILETRDERFIPIQAPTFSLQLFSPVNWQMIPNTDFSMEKWEHITCCKNVILSYEGDRSGLRGYIAIGTTFCYNEDITCRGRILIFDIIEVVPEPGQPLTKNRLKLLYEGEQKGPVSALANCCGYLVAAIGQKIYIWQLRDKSLVGVAFIDTQIYVHQIMVLKNLILVADVCKSVTLMRFQEDSRTLSMASKDIRPLEIYGIQYLVDNTSVAFVASDADKNIVVFTYNPESRESMGGTRLIRKGDFHLGSHVNSFFRIRCRLSEMSPEIRSSIENRHLTMFATLDGSIGFLLPVNEKTYRRLSMIANVLTHHMAHPAALNPKACRSLQTRHKNATTPKRGILDGNLIWSFLHLPVPEKVEVARKIGARVDDIIDDLIDIDRMTLHF